MPATLLATSETHIKPHTRSIMTPAPEENMIRQAWHSLEEALHLREPVPPPVPPKDEKWLIKTVNLALPQDEPDPSFWDKIVQRIAALHSHTEEEEEQDAVSISVPAEAALRQLGVQADDSEIQAKKDYFERMAVRCKEKFDQDRELPIQGTLTSLDNDEIPSSSDSSQHRHHHQLHHYFRALHHHFHPHHEAAQDGVQGRQNSHMIPKVDPKEMKAAHSIIYHSGKESVDDNDEEDRKLFGPWWGCHSKRSKDEKQLLSRQESEWEIINLPTSKKEKRKSLGEQNGSSTLDTLTTTGNKTNWWKQKPFDSKGLMTLPAKNEQTHDRKATTKRHQAIAAAAAYEAVKEYQARKVRQGKKVTHGEMKAILAGIAMAEAIKILESRHGDDDNDEDRNETVAEAGSVALKLFELLR
ncbi:hypothetical protein BGZ79_002466 [Entomortierella chlamydospora]|nr:hypothetical protein BGZ79_002466 [Entomortierella chlamydospora]